MDIIELKSDMAEVKASPEGQRNNLRVPRYFVRVNLNRKNSLASVVNRYALTQSQRHRGTEAIGFV